MQKHKNSGPIPKSCRTCRVRLKRCDGVRPVCDRCSAGGFYCWGFELLDENTQNLNSSFVIEASGNIQQSMFPDTVISSNAPRLAEVVEHSVSAVPTQVSHIRPFYHSGEPWCQQQQTEWASAPLTSEHTKVFQSQSNVLDEAEKTLIDDHARNQTFATAGSPCWQTQPLTVTNTATQVVAPVPRKLGTYSECLSNETSSSSKSLLAQNLGDSSCTLTLTTTVSILPVDVRDVVKYVATRYDGAISTMFFTPPHELLQRTRGAVCQRVQFFPADRCALLLGAKIFDSMLDNVQDQSQKIAQRLAMITRFEQKLSLAPVQDLASAKAQSYLRATLTMLALKLRTASGANARADLHKYAPVFLQIVSLDPALCPSSQHVTTVSIARILASIRYELPHFALLDTVYSMAYGLPLVIKYDTSLPPFKHSRHPVGWLYGCSAELNIMIINLSQLLEQKQTKAPIDWQHFERRLWNWQPTLFALSGEESWKRVGRLAIQESWRHTIFIYFYLAICGFQSDDPRVRSSVRQVFQIMSTIKHEQQATNRIDFSLQYLFAGACTPSETQRGIARDQLCSSRDSGHWLLDGSTFVPVLDHLWHGAGANGRAIGWSDYLHSRQVMLPVPI